MDFSQNAIKVLERRYLTKDEAGNPVESVEELFRRVADTIASADKLYDPKADTKKLSDRFFELMTNRLFMPNSPTLMNAGKPLGQLSACFVLPVPDSMDGIFDAVKNAALIHKSGGGTGFSFSRIRSAGSAVRSTGGVASGPISFMKVFNAATEAVKQGGTRRGANMGILRVDHPDILDFIQCKKDNHDITNFNISIGLTEAFMAAVEKDELYDLVDPRTHEVRDRLRAREVFDLVVDMAWNNGEPGIIFLDRLNRDNVVPKLGEIESTNPCGEQPLLPYESCNLGSLNVEAFLKGDDAGRLSIDYEQLGQAVDDAVHFLDNVIDVNKYPLPEIEQTTKNTRKIGLGIMGFADLLFRLGIGYNTDAAIALARELMGFIRDRGREASRNLAKARGAFPAFEDSVFAGQEPIRNATITTIAPTGTISIIAGVSSGIEPLFALSFVRNVMDNDELPEVHGYFSQVAKERGFYSPELMRAIAREGTVAHLDGVPEDVRKTFVTAHDITPEYHIRMQAAFQEFTDNAVSKTVNFPNSATRQDVRDVYWLAYTLGCKGVTIYRDGSRDAQVLNVGAVNRAEAEAPAANAPIVPRPRPELTRGFTEKVRIGCGNLYITVNYDEKGICEVFTNLGRAGGCPSQSEATSRLISNALRAGMDVESVVEQLKGIRCHSTLRQKGLNVLSCPDAIGKAIEKAAAMMREDPTMPHLPNIPVAAATGCLENCSLCAKNDTCKASKVSGSVCPDCGDPLEHSDGCVICRTCGYSKCN